MRTRFHTETLPPKIALELEGIGRLYRRNGFWELEHGLPLDLERYRSHLQADVNTFPERFDPAKVGLLVTDLDSTLIGCETIDEIADLLGLREEIAAITERAMQGELDFAEALAMRVALLEGLPVERLEEVYRNRYRLEPFALQTLAQLRRWGVKTAVVSGGFTFFTDRLLEALPLDFAHANRLEVKGGRLTGRIEGKVVDGSGKRAFLEELRRRFGLAPEEVVAVGDGANDLQMVEASGFSIGYRPKPILRERVDALVLYGDWRTILQLLWR